MSKSTDSSFNSTDQSVSSACCKHGPGFKTPMDAFLSGPKHVEKIFYVTGVCTDESKPDALFTVDVDPSSETYQQVVHTLEMPFIGDELHHTGWNVCSSCHDDTSKQRRFLILPGVRSGRIYVVDTIEQRNPKIHHIISPEEFTQYGLSHPHTVHCLASGEIMVSTMGDKNGDGKGGFMLIDHAFKVKGRWSQAEEDKHLQYGYDYWYQPYHNVCISSEWGSPNSFNNGFNPNDVQSKYGNSLYFWNWNERKVIKKVELGEDGKIPLEVRFLHDPKKAHGFVGAALSSSVFHFYKSEDEWNCEKIIQVEPVEVENWALSHMPGLITDILVSMDDKFLYFSNWLHGDIRQYDIRDPFNPKLTGQVFVGGSIRKDGKVKAKSETIQKKFVANDLTSIKGETVNGGAQMLQLSLDGKRLYVTTSLYSSWDKQFYGEIYNTGASIIKVDVDIENGGMKVDEQFHVKFNNKNGSSYLVHEMRYPGGDCTSDVYLA